VCVYEGNRACLGGWAAGWCQQQADARRWAAPGCQPLALAIIAFISSSCRSSSLSASVASLLASAPRLAGAGACAAFPLLFPLAAKAALAGFAAGADCGVAGALPVGVGGVGVLGSALGVPGGVTSPSLPPVLAAAPAPLSAGLPRSSLGNGRAGGAARAGEMGGPPSETDACKQISETRAIVRLNHHPEQGTKLLPSFR